MDDERKSVLVTALSVYAELLAKNKRDLELKQGKGKGKASDTDVDLDLEVQNHIKICQELSNRVGEAVTGKDLILAFDTSIDLRVREQTLDWEDYSDDHHTTDSDSIATKDWNRSLDANITDRHISGQKHEAFNPFMTELEDEAYVNPFTGLEVVRETGFEAGPSYSKPSIPSLHRKPLPASSSSVPIAKPRRQLSDPKLLRTSYPIKSSQDSLSTGDVPEVLQVSVEETPSPPPNQPVRLPDTLETEVPSTIFPPELPSPQPLVDLGPEPSLQAVGLQSESQGGLPRSSIQRNKYTSYVAGLTSKALKATGYGPRLNRTSSFNYSVGVGDRVPANPPVQTFEDLPEYAIDYTPVLALTTRISQDTLPPAYDALPEINRRNSIASSLPGIGTISRSLSLPFSLNRNSLTQTISSKFDPDSQQDGAVNARRSFGLWKSNSRSSTSTVPPLQQSSASTSDLPNITSNVKRRSVYKPSTIVIQEGIVTPSLFPRSTAQIPETPSTGRRLRRSTTTQSLIIAHPEQDVLEQVTSDAILAQSMFESKDNFDSWGPVDALFPEPPRNQHRHHSPSMHSHYKERPSPKSFGSSHPSQELRSEPVVLHDSATHFGSNNPYVASIAADQALARALQQEEERELQLERDHLFALKVQNGTADEDDFDVAHFISQQSAKVTEPAITTEVHTVQLNSSSNPWGALDPQQIRSQSDRLKAQELDSWMNTQASADQDNLLAAMRLQEQYDQEEQNEQAWEAWKSNNVATCTSCMEEHARDELVQGACEHGYCNGCLQEGFKAALQSRSPFKCCKEPLDIRDCLRLHDQFVLQYQEMVLELSTPNPMFCCNTKCTKFLPPRVITGDVGVCDKCSTKTCRHCRKKTHPGTFCAEDKETEAVKNLAKAKGWKTCPGCNHLIERRDGCLHMVCSRCNTPFCYRCSKPWKDCLSSCPDR